MLFYCPTRHAARHRFSMKGYWTTYGANPHAMGIIMENVPIPMSYSDWEVPHKSNEFKYQDRIIFLYEGNVESHVSVGIGDFEEENPAVVFPHNGQTHVLRMDGTVSALKEKFPLDVWLTDYVR